MSAIDIIAAWAKLNALVLAVILYLEAITPIEPVPVVRVVRR